MIRKERGMAIGGKHPRAREFAAVFQQAGIACSYLEDAESLKWSKLLLNLLGNASSAILDMSPAAIFNHPGLYRLEIDGIRETLRIMKAREIDVVDLPGVPVRLLAAVIQSFPALISQPFLSFLIGRGRGEKMPSFHIDLHSGRGRSEVNMLNGAVVRAGEAESIPTPVNQLLTETLRKLIHGELPLDTYAHQPEKLLQELR